MSEENPNVECATALSVLREHCQFLKQQLADRESWRQKEIDRLNAKNEQWSKWAGES